MPNYPFSRLVRLRRLYRHHRGRLFMVPLDHSVTDGPLSRRRSLDELIEGISRGAVDAVVLHKGSLRYLNAVRFDHMSLIVQLSASTRHAPDPDAKILVASVEEALRLGADAVSVHVNLGSAQESRQIADLAAVADSCDRWGVPLLAMMYPRGPRIADPPNAELCMHAAVLAADLGADIVKIPRLGSTDELRDVVAASPIPTVVAGGSPTGTREKPPQPPAAMRSGVGGVAIGRNVFQAPDPCAMARRIAQIVHDPLEVARKQPRVQHSGAVG